MIDGALNLIKEIINRWEPILQHIVGCWGAILDCNGGIDRVVPNLHFKLSGIVVHTVAGALVVVVVVNCAMGIPQNAESVQLGLMISSIGVQILLRFCFQDFQFGSTHI